MTYFRVVRLELRNGGFMKIYVYLLHFKRFEGVQMRLRLRSIEVGGKRHDHHIYFRALC